MWVRKGQELVRRGACRVSASVSEPGPLRAPPAEARSVEGPCLTFCRAHVVSVTWWLHILFDGELAARRFPL